MLPQDLITEILLRLPVNSLLRFKCVSKQWLSLISDTHFRHHHRHASSGVILCRKTDIIHHVSLAGSNSDYQPFTSLCFIDDSVGVKILQSSHGLLLCCSNYKLGKARSYYICNPSTKKYSILPEPDYVSGSDNSSVYLVFNPTKSPHYRVACVLPHSIATKLRFTHPKLGIGGLPGLLSLPHSTWCSTVGCSGMLQYTGLVQLVLRYALTLIKNALEQCLVCRQMRNGAG